MPLTKSNGIVQKILGANALRAILILTVLCLSSCRALPPIQKVDLAGPGWNVRQGQAIWRPSRSAPEISGDLIVATHADLRAFVQFSKSPMTLAVAVKTRDSWQAEFPFANRRYAGHGSPPARLTWLMLAATLSGASPPPPWKWHESDGNLRLENMKTGESLAGYLSP